MVHALPLATGTIDTFDFDMTGKELTFDTRYGQLAGLQWGTGNDKKVVAFHGWLDNAASFAHVAPFLAEAGFEVNAIDFPGHGHSDHKAPGHNYGFIDYVIDIQSVMAHFDEPVIFVCHSMGAAIGQMYASAYPEQVSHLILIENTGPIPAYVSGTAAKSLREALDVWDKHTLEHKRCYQKVDDAIKARQQVTPMDTDIIHPLVRRGLKKTAAGFHWRTDKRLKLRSFFRMSEAQVQDFLQATKIPCQLIIAEPRTYALDYAAVDDRIKALDPDALVKLSGCHHLHMTQARTVATEVLSFLNQNTAHTEASDKATDSAPKHAINNEVKAEIDTKVRPRPFHPFES